MEGTDYKQASLNGRLLQRSGTRDREVIKPRSRVPLRCTQATLYIFIGGAIRLVLNIRLQTCYFSDSAPIFVFHMMS